MYNFLLKYKSVFIFTVKALIICGAYYLISEKIRQNHVISGSQFLSSVQEVTMKKPLVIISILSLTLLNWILEIFKWKNLASTCLNITYYEALKQSLASLTASLLTPNRIGEYGAKAIYYPSDKRYQVLFLNFLGNFTQMGATLLFGLMGLFFIHKMIPFNLNFPLLLLIYGILGIVIYFAIQAHKSIKGFFLKFLGQWNEISKHVHIKNISLSILRYLVFSHQFYFLVVIFGAELNYFTGMPIIFTMYLLASFIPGFVVFDWLVKGSVAVTLFALYGIDEILVLSITSIMWLLNFALPATIGSYYILTFGKSKTVKISSL